MNAGASARMLAGGLTSTAAVTAVAYLGPLVGLPMVDVAACYASIFAEGHAEGAREWWAGLMIHFGLGGLVLPAVFERAILRVLAIPREAAGMALGFLAYLAFGGIVLPLAGQGAFGWRSPDPLLLNFALIGGGALYGLGLARLGARAEEPAALPSLAGDRRAA